jgi:hypothetical protein
MPVWAACKLVFLAKECNHKLLAKETGKSGDPRVHAMQAHSFLDCTFGSIACANFL